MLMQQMRLVVVVVVKHGTMLMEQMRLVVVVVDASLSVAVIANVAGKAGSLLLQSAWILFFLASAILFLHLTALVVAFGMSAMTLQRYIAKRKVQERPRARQLRDFRNIFSPL